MTSVAVLSLFADDQMVHAAVVRLVRICLLRKQTICQRSKAVHVVLSNRSVLAQKPLSTVPFMFACALQLVKDLRDDEKRRHQYGIHDSVSAAVQF